MKVILLEDIKGQGKKGQLVNISDGYARNYLIPKNLVTPATSKNVNELKQKQKAEARQRELEKQAVQEIYDKINGKTFTVKVKCGDSGKLFGSVTSKEIAQALQDKGYDIDKKKVMLKEPIKSVGREMIDIKLYSNIVCKVNIVIEG